MNAGKQPILTQLSAAQLGIWVAQMLNPQSAIFNITEYVEILGPVDPGRFETALRLIVAAWERGAFSPRSSSRPSTLDTAPARYRSRRYQQLGVGLPCRTMMPLAHDTSVIIVPEGGEAQGAIPCDGQLVDQSKVVDYRNLFATVSDFHLFDRL